MTISRYDVSTNSQATLDVVLLVSYISAATRFAVSSDSYLEVIRSIAGPETGITVVDKARLAQISTKVRPAPAKIALQICSS